MSIAVILALFAANTLAQTATQPTLPTNPVTCVNNAVTYGLLTQQQAYQLCVGSNTSAPFDCFQQATRTAIDEATALKLCRCAVSTSRVDCYNQAHGTTQLSDNEILDLCTHDVPNSECRG